MGYSKIRDERVDRTRDVYAVSPLRRTRGLVSVQDIYKYIYIYLNYVEYNIIITVGK